MARRGAEPQAALSFDEPAPQIATAGRVAELPGIIAALRSAGGSAEIIQHYEAELAELEARC